MKRDLGSDNRRRQDDKSEQRQIDIYLMYNGTQLLTCSTHQSLKRVSLGKREEEQPTGWYHLVAGAMLPLSAAASM